MASGKAFTVRHISHLLCAAYEQTVYAFRTFNNFPSDQSGGSILQGVRRTARRVECFCALDCVSGDGDRKIKFRLKFPPDWDGIAVRRRRAVCHAFRAIATKRC